MRWLHFPNRFVEKVELLQDFEKKLNIMSEKGESIRLSKQFDANYFAEYVIYSLVF